MIMRLYFKTLYVFPSVTNCIFEWFIKHLKLKPKKIYYQPCDNVAIIRRLLENMIYVFEKLGHLEKIKELKSLIRHI